MADKDPFEYFGGMETPGDGEAFASGATRVDCPPGISMYTADEMRKMAPAELVSHAARLQQLYRQLESDNKFLSWEFQEFQESFTYFSRAAKLAHKLSASDVDTVADLAVREIPLYFNCDYAALFFYDADEGVFHFYRSSNGEPEPLEPVNREAAANLLLTRIFCDHEAPFIAEYIESENRFVTDLGDPLPGEIRVEWIRLLGPKAIIFPLRIQYHDGREPLILGGLVIGGPSGNLAAKDAEVSIVFADLLSSSLYNARLVKRLNELTILDPLTNTYNRRHLINQLGAAMVQSRRHGHDLSIAMLDIDHFKRVNDTYGHIVGDKVLRELALLLKNSIRTDIDIPARYGGEEFVVIMPFTDVEQAYKAAERLRMLIGKHVFELEGLRLEVTCSIGVAEYSVNESLERLLGRADVALYQAKKKGRNCVIAASSCRDGA